MTLEDSTARKMASEAREIAIENRTWRKEHDINCREFVREIKAMMAEMSRCMSHVKQELKDVVAEAERARSRMRQDSSAMWLRISWGALGAVSTALVGLLIAIVRGWIN